MKRRGAGWSASEGSSRSGEGTGSKACARRSARVSAAGELEGVSLERSSGHEVLDRSALDGVKRWRFIPATRGGVPVPCEVSIPVAFRLTE